MSITEYLNWILSQDWIWDSLKDKIRPVLESRPIEQHHNEFDDIDDYWNECDQYDYNVDWDH